jgi:pimeloyl-ACP methyl ester carboxylesterase
LVGAYPRAPGGAPPPRDPATVTVEQFAADSHTVTRAVAPGGVALVGLSFGVQVALEHYRRCPADVRALVLICGTYGHPLDRIARAAALRRGAAAFVRGFCRLGPAARVALGVVRTPVARELTYLSGGARRELCPRQSLDELFGHVARLEPRVFGEICAAYFEHSALDVLPTIRVPTLIIAGDRDQLTPVSIAERMQAQIPGARLRVFPGHSHLVQLERPEAVHAAVADFLAGAGLVPAD